MSIQSNINTGLSLASFLIGQNPNIQEASKKRAELKSLEKRAEAVSSYSAAINQGIAQTLMAGNPEATEQGFKDLAKYRAEGAEIAEQQFKLDPSKETYEAWKNEEGRRDLFSKLAENASVKAQDALKAQQDMKRKSRRSFIDYMKDEPTSLGGSFGELDPKLQKMISQHYSKAERKKIMDRKDAANE